MESYGEFMMTPMMEATVESVDEAILNALFTGGDMTGRDGNVRDGLPVDKVIGYLKHHNMWVDPEA